MMRVFTLPILCVTVCWWNVAWAADNVPMIQSAKSGAWSDKETWQDGQIPGAGSRVQVRSGHRVLYDVNSETPIRFIHVAGTLTFAKDRNTRLVAGLIRIEPGDNATEEGFDCDVVQHGDHHHGPKPALEVGTMGQPIPRPFTAQIQLKLFPGMDPKSCPAIVSCAGRMDFHGTPMSSTWAKLAATVKKGDSAVQLDATIDGTTLNWQVGDRVIITATKLSRDHSQGPYQTEERQISQIEGYRVTLDQPLKYDHLGEGDYRGEIGNLSRNVVVESADPNEARGHTMYHRDSAGSISYAEFRHLGKQGTLGRYSLHFHLCGSTMRGSSVIGASIWDSGNRWLTIHGTNYLVVRDCIGYRSIGHGFFLEDGTEVYNVLDHNLAVRADEGRPLPKQVLAFDANEGSGFWWANSLNTFTRNVTCENNRYGYRFEAVEGSQFKPTLAIMQPDGTEKPVDIRTLPFIRFEQNESHCDGLYGLNLGEGVNRVGPDERHPFIVRDMKIWEIHYAFRPQSPSLLVENLKILNSAYGVYHPNFDRHVYRNVEIRKSGNSGDAEPFNRGHDDDSKQFGVVTVDGLTFAGHHFSDMPLIQITDDNPTGKAETHIRNVKVEDRRDNNRRALANRGGGPRPTPTTPIGVPVYLHHFFGPGETAKVVSTKANDFASDTTTPYQQLAGVTGDESRIAKVSDVPFPELLHPVDDLPPATVVTSFARQADGRWVLRGTVSDQSAIQKVVVQAGDDEHVADLATDGTWSVLLDGRQADSGRISVGSIDAVGNRELTPHMVSLSSLE